MNDLSMLWKKFCVVKNTSSHGNCHYVYDDDHHDHKIGKTLVAKTIHDIKISTACATRPLAH